MVTVGIDFGTTNSTVAYTREGMISVVEIDQSARSIPSCVSFASHERLVGASAIHQMAKNSVNTIFDVKRLLGCTRNELQRHIKDKLLPFSLSGEDEEAKIQVQYKGTPATFYPEEIVASIFHRLEEITIKYVEGKISGAVITVPTYFNARQRTAIKYAAEIAEVPLLGLVNETTAAAISYGVKIRTGSTRTILVFHLGGGSFDVALVEIRNGEYNIKAAAGSSRLGGDDFTTELFKKCLKIFSQKNRGMHTKDITLRACARLRLACEKAKKDLGIASQASIRVDSFYADEDFEHIVTEEEFEGINERLVEEMRNIIARVFDDAGSGKETVDDIIAVGAATRMKLANKLFKDYGEGKIRKIINTNEAVALGAAAYADSLSGACSHGKLNISDVLSHAVYYEHKILFERGIELPSQPQRKIDISNDTKTSLKLYYRDELFRGQPTQDEHVYEGYEEYVMGGTEKSVNIKFEIDVDGQLKVSVGEEVKWKSPLRKTADVKTLIKRAIDMRNEEKKAQQILKSLHELEKKVYDLEGNARKIQISTIIKEKILNDCNDVIKFIQGVSNPTVDDISRINSKLQAIDQEIIGKIATGIPTTLQPECPGNDLQSKFSLPGQILDENPQEEQTKHDDKSASGGSRKPAATRFWGFPENASPEYQIDTRRPTVIHAKCTGHEPRLPPGQILDENLQEKQTESIGGTRATMKTDSTGSDDQLKTSIMKQRLKPPQSQESPQSNTQKDPVVWNNISADKVPSHDESTGLLNDDHEEDDDEQSQPCWCTIS